MSHWTRLVKEEKQSKFVNGTKSLRMQNGTRNIFKGTQFNSPQNWDGSLNWISKLRHPEHDQTWRRERKCPQYGPKYEYAFYAKHELEHFV